MHRMPTAYALQVNRSFACVFARPRRRRYGPPRRRTGHQQRIAGDHVVDIFDEVDEELRAERAQQLLKRYGGLIVAGALAIVGAAAGWQGWRWYQARQDQAAAVEYLTAMNLADATAAGSSDANRTAGIAAFAQLAAKAPEGYATLARLREAALKADAGDLPGAAALWDQRGRRRLGRSAAARPREPALGAAPDRRGRSCRCSRRG